MKTKEELNAIKEEVEVLNKKLAELTSGELEQVTGGFDGYDVTERHYNFTAGDTFVDISNPSMYYVVERSRTDARPNELISVEYYRLVNGVYHLSWNTLNKSASVFENNYTFLGNNYLAGAAIVRDERPKDI